MLGWLTKLTLVLSLLGVLAFDGIAVAQARFNVEDHATQAARAAAAELSSSGDPQLAALAASEVLAETGETLTGVSLLPDGAVQVTATREATTLVLRRVGPLEDWATQTATATGRPPS